MRYQLLLLCIVPAISAANSCRRANGHEVCKIGNKKLSYAAGKYAKCKQVCKYGKRCNKLCMKCKRLCTAKPAPPQKFVMPAICKLKKDEGEGNQMLLRSWFSTLNNNTCQLFWYRGTKGNANRFNTIQDCWKTCAPDQVPKGGHCYMKEEDKKYGPCTWHWGYRFNATSKKCQFFKDDGCFRTKAECMQKCRPSLPPPSPPQPLPKVKFYKLKKGKVKCCIGNTKKCTTHTNKPKCRKQLLRKFKYIK